MRNRPIPRDLTQRTAASFLFAGAMLARFGRVQIGRPGGDDLGPRPIGHHLAAFRALGASVCEGEDAVEVALASKPPLSTVDLVLPSSSGAVNVVLAAHRNCLTLRLRNAPIDADMTAFWRLLRRYGTAVRRDGPVILCECRPPERARPEPMVITCPPDRNDAFTWLAAGALTTKGLLVRHVHSRELASGIAVLRALGTTIEQSGRHALVVKRPPGGLVIATMTTIAAGSSPDFHSDWMPLLHLVLVTARGRACTVDRIYSNRIRQAVLLKSMGARIAIRGGDPPPGVDVYFSTPLDQARYVVEISGPARLKAVKCTVGNDIRAAAVAVLAATVAEGRSHIKNANALYRGYQDFASRLRALGTDIGSSPR
jgi:UDP-N-acetylglucosamine 1-carboxyvinyltransferase